MRQLAAGDFECCTYQAHVPGLEAGNNLTATADHPHCPIAAQHLILKVKRFLRLDSVPYGFVDAFTIRGGNGLVYLAEG